MVNNTYHKRMYSNNQSILIVVVFRHLLLETTATLADLKIEWEKDADDTPTANQIVRTIKIA